MTSWRVINYFFSLFPFPIFLLLNIRSGHSEWLYISIFKIQATKEEVRLRYERSSHHSKKDKMAWACVHSNGETVITLLVVWGMSAVRMIVTECSGMLNMVKRDVYTYQEIKGMLCWIVLLTICLKGKLHLPESSSQGGLGKGACERTARWKWSRSHYSETFITVRHHEGRMQRCPVCQLLSSALHLACLPNYSPCWPAAASGRTPGSWLWTDLFQQTSPQAPTLRSHFGSLTTRPFGIVCTLWLLYSLQCFRRMLGDLFCAPLTLPFRPALSYLSHICVRYNSYNNPFTSLHGSLASLMKSNWSCF